MSWIFIEFMDPRSSQWSKKDGIWFQKMITAIVLHFQMGMCQIFTKKKNLSRNIQIFGRIETIEVKFSSLMVTSKMFYYRRLLLLRWFNDFRQT